MRLLMLSLGLVVLATPAAAEPEPMLPPGAMEVRIERARPPREKLPTLRFLKDNRDFLRGRFDALRAESRAPAPTPAALDPRWLDYQRFLASVASSRDSLRNDPLAGGDSLLARVARLAELEARLDVLERQQDAQEQRLARLQRDFTGEQRTALAVLVRGGAGTIPPERIEVRTEDGATTRVELTEGDRTVLAQGGALEVWHRYVEPRRQILEVQCAGSGWAEQPAFLDLEPERDQLTLLHLDFRRVEPAAGSAGLRAAVWRHDTRVP